MPRFELQDNNIYDNKKKEIIFKKYDRVRFEDVCDIFNELEVERLQYKRELATLKHRIRELVK